MRDVAFYFKKKTGMPKLTDSGLADVVLGGEGLTVSLDNLTIKLIDSSCICSLGDGGTGQRGQRPLVRVQG